MSKEKQIEEMACAICGNSKICVGEGVNKCILHPQMWRYANNAYKEGYRKQSENTIELPYKVGRTVYVLRSQTSNGKNLYLREERIDHYRIFSERSFMCFESGRLSVPDYLWETSVFLTQEEAEAKMKGGAE